MKMKRFQTRLLLALLLSALILLEDAGRAAVINWSAPRDIASDTDVSTNGVLVKAIAKSGTAYPTVNGVTFTPAYGSDSVSGTNASNYPAGAMPVGGGISQSYSTLLSQNDYNNSAGSTVTLTISGLTVGYHYEIQVWMNDSNATGQGTLTVKSPGSMDPWVMLDANTSGVAGGVGQYAIGTLTADSTSQVVTFQGSVNGMIQAYQVRRVAAPLAAVAWEAWQETTGDTDVNTDGTSVRAYVFGSAAPVAPINGVTFTRFADQVTDTLSGFTVPSADIFSSPNAPYSGLSADYKKLLGGGAYGGRYASLTLNNLQPGQWYEAQVWVNDSRAVGGGRMERINGSLYLNYNPGGPLDNLAYEGGLGHWMLGSFQANASSQRLDFVADVSAQINGLQLRAIPAPDYYVNKFKQRRLYLLNGYIDGKRTSSLPWPGVQGWYATGNLTKAKAVTKSVANAMAASNPGGTSCFDYWPAMDAMIRWKKYIDSTTRNQFVATLRKCGHFAGNTSNLSKLWWTIRVLGSQEFGEDAFIHPDNDWRPLDPTGYGPLLNRVDGEAKNGAGEYASCPYGWYNIMPTLTLSQLCTDGTMRTHSQVSFNSDLAQLAAVWMPDGYTATFSGRSYPEAGGAMSLGRLLWGWFGDGAGSSQCQESIMVAATNFIPPTPLLNAGGDRTTIYTSRHHCDAFQTAWIYKDQYGLFSHDGTGGGLQQYSDGVRWKGMQNYFWLTKPAQDGPGNYGSSCHCQQNSDYSTVQYKDSMVLAFDLSWASATNLHYALGFVPGNYQAMFNLTGTAVGSGTTNRIFLHYGTVMIAVASDIPFTWNPNSGNYGVSGSVYTGDSEFRVAVGGVGYPQIDGSNAYTANIDPVNNRFAMAVETAHPSEYPGATAADQLAAFKADILARTTLAHDAPSPTVAHYTNRHADTLQAQSKNLWARNDPTLMPPAYINGTAVDYTNFPQLENPWMTQARNGSTAVYTSGTSQTVLDFTNWTVTNSTFALTGSLPQINSTAAAGVTGTSAVLTGNMVSTGSSAATVTLYWGLVDSGTNAVGWTHSQSLGVQNTGALLTPLAGLSGTTTYYYRYYASNASGGAWSGSTVSFTSLDTPPPAVPGNLSTLLTIGSVPLTWSAATDASSYNIKRATTGGGPYTVIKNGNIGTSYTDTTAVPGTAYYYVVSAVGAGGKESLNSAEIMTTAAVIPSAPGGLTASTGYMYAHLSWNSALWATTYSIWRSGTSGGPYQLINSGVTGTSYDDSSSVNLSTYYYVVGAANVSGTSGNSNQASLTVNVTSYIDQVSGNWNTITWFPNPPGRPTAGSTTIIDFNNNSALASNNDMGSFTLNQMRFLGQGVTLTGSTLVFSGTNPLVTGSAAAAGTVANAITLNANTEFEIDTSSLSLNGVVSGSSSLNKTGSGTLSLGGSNTYTGNTIVDGGTLAFTADNAGLKTILLGGSAGALTASSMNISANVTGTNMTVQATGVTNLMSIASGKTFTISGLFLAGNLSTYPPNSNLTVSGSGTFKFNNSTGTMVIRRGSIVDLSAVANVNIVASNLNIGDLDWYTATYPSTLLLSANGNTTIKVDTINLDSATWGGGTGRGESASLIAPAGSGTLTIRNAAGTGPAALLMDKHAGSGSQNATTTFDVRGHYADINLSTLDVSHRTSTSGGGSGLGYFYFDTGVLTVSGTTWIATSDSGVVVNNATLEIDGGTATFGAVNLGNASNGQYVTGQFNVTDGTVICGKITAARAATGAVYADVTVTGGLLTMTDDMVSGLVSGSYGTTASYGIARLTVDGGTLDMAGHAIGITGFPFSLVAFNSGTVENIGSINGNGGFTKNNPGIIIITGNNTYTGPTAINVDEMEVDGVINSTAAVTIGVGATLSGTGTIKGPVTVSGSLTPGININNVGSLAINNDLTLGSNSFTTMSIDRVSASNGSSVIGIATMTYGGALTVVNNGTALVDGDRFVLFAAASYLGSFGSFNLPALGANLVWDTRSLGVDGSITVRATTNGTLATVKYWDTSANAGLQGGTGTWDLINTSVWNTAGDGSAILTKFWNYDTAIFQNGSANIVALNGTVAVDSIQQLINNTSTTINGGMLILTGSGGISNGVNSGNAALTINSAATLNNVGVTVNARQAVTLNSGLGGAGDLTKSGTAALTLGSYSPFIGQLLLDDGTLNLNGDAPNIQNLYFGITQGGTNATTLNLAGNVNSPALVVQNFGNNYMTIAAGRTLTVSGNLTMGYGVNPVSNGSLTSLTISGSGSLVFNKSGGIFQVGSQNGGTNVGDNGGTLDMSGLANFYVDMGSSGIFRLGFAGTGSTSNPEVARLAATSTIKAGTLGISDTGGDGARNALYLGSGAQTIQANTINMGINSRPNSLLQFNTLTGSVTVTGYAGGGTTANLTMGQSTSTTGGTSSSTFDVSGHMATIALGSLNMAARNAVSPQNENDIFKFDTGTLTVASQAVLANNTGANTSPNIATMTLGGGLVGTGTATFTNGLYLAQNGDTHATASAATATLNINGNGGYAFNVTSGQITMGSLAGSTNASNQVSATVNLLGGTLTMTGDIISGGTGSGIASRTINLNGGTLDMGNHNIGGAVAITGSFQSGTLKNLNEYNNGGSLTKTGTGTLSLSGTNTYTGQTTLTSGTLGTGSNYSLGAVATAAQLNLNGGTLLATSSFALDNSGSNKRNVVLTGTGTIDSSANTLGISGTMSGTGSLIKIGVGTLALYGSNAFMGGVAINEGTVTVTNSSALGTGAKTITITSQPASGAYPGLVLDGGSGDINLPSGIAFATSGANAGYGPVRNLAGNNTINGPITLASGNGGTSIYSNGGTLTLAGNITANTTGRTLVLGGAGNGTVSGNIVNTGTYAFGVTKSDAGTWTLSGSNNYTGATAINEGTLALIGGVASSVTVSSGALAPQGSPSVTGNLTVTSGGTLRVRINGPAAGMQYDQLAVSGTVTLSGALEVVAGPGLAAGTSFTILNKTSAGAISGAFAGKAEGSVFSSGGYSWIISYIGGTGNDVVLTLATKTQAWRYANFGTTANSGNAADSADPDKDGLNNLMEFSLGLDPNKPSVMPATGVLNGGNLEYTYTRSKAAVADGVLFTVEYSDTLASGSWSTVGISNQNPPPIAQDANTETLKISVPAGSGSRRFVHLKITR